MKKLFMFLALIAFILSGDPCNECVEKCKAKYVGDQRTACIGDCILEKC